MLGALLAAAAAGTGGVVEVSGPAGIGKTSLLAASATLAAESGMRCLTARGRELDRGFSFGVVRQLFERMLHDCSEAERELLVAGAAGLAAPVLGLAEPAAPVGDAFGVLHGLYWLCANLTAQRPLLIAVDDVQWADDASLRFLGHLGARASELPLLVVVAARRVAELAEPGLTGAPDALSIALRGLTATGVGRLVQAQIGTTPDPGVVRAMHHATAGNPFLTVTLADAAARRSAAAVGSADLAIADAARAVATVAAARLRRLPPAAGELARAVSVFGGATPSRVILALAGLDEAQAPPLHDMLAGEEILQAWPAMEFVHPLLETAVRESIPAAERAWLHTRAAGLLFAHDASAERVSLQLLGSSPVGERWAVESLRAAAALALAHGDAPAAVTYLRRALHEPGVGPKVVHELGAAELHAGDYVTAAEHLTAARDDSRDPIKRAHVARDLSQALATPGRYGEAVEVLDAAIGELSDRGDDLVMRLQGERFQAAMMDPTLYRRAAAPLVQLHREPPGASAGARAMLTAMATEGCLRTVPAARVRAWAQTAFARGILDDQEPYASLWGNAAFPLIFADGFEAAVRVSVLAVEDARRRGSPIGGARAFAVSAMLALRQGRVRDAETDARTATELGLRAGFAVSLIPLGVLIDALVERGQLDAAEAELRAAARGGGHIAERFLENWVLHARGRLRLAQGRLEDTINDLEELGRRGEHGWRPWNPGMFCYRSDLAIAFVRIGQLKRARELADAELAIARRWGAPRAIGVALRTAGLTAANDKLEPLRASVQVLADSGATLEHARSLVELGAAIRRSGHRAAAREPLRLGMDLAARCGATALTARAREELVAAGARPRRSSISGVDSLTPSERRVARLARQGLTNPQIAQTLFVTQRTVQVHLTNTYRKLNIQSRTQLPDDLITVEPNTSATDV